MAYSVGDNFFASVGTKKQIIEISTGKVRFAAAITASVSISASPSGRQLSGTSITFTAVPTNGGTPSYQWKVNGGNVGTNSNQYTSTTLADNDQVTCVMTSSVLRVSGGPATSNTITMDLYSIVTLDYYNYDDEYIVQPSSYLWFQSFTPNQTAILSSTKFYGRKVGSPSGTATMKIYNHSGTYGTSSVRTGAALATSDDLNKSSFPSSNDYVTFTFSGANKITLTSGTRYVLSIETTINGDGSNHIKIWTDNSTSSHGGNESYIFNTIYGPTPIVSEDWPFYVYGEV